MTACPVCGGTTALLGSVDFSKSCMEAVELIRPTIGIPIEYNYCLDCAFAFAPGMHAWTSQQFTDHVYNEGYVSVDPEYIDIRPQGTAENLLRTFKHLPASVRHLDYGGGSGRLSEILFNAGWDSLSIDPHADPKADLTSIGKFDFITAIEVFEHVSNVMGLMANLDKLLRTGGLVYFTTLVSDGHLSGSNPLAWWYAAPRNGHISLFSKRALAVLAYRCGFRLGSFNENVHVLWRGEVPWAQHVLPKGL